MWFRSRVPGQFVAVALCLLIAGCGGGSSITTGTVAAGTVVSPAQYLADTNATARAIREYVAVVNALPTPMTQRALTEAAPALQEPLAAAQLAQARLVAGRLEDSRLETQRVAVERASTPVIVAMGELRAAAATGNLA